MLNTEKRRRYWNYLCRFSFN